VETLITISLLMMVMTKKEERNKRSLLQTQPKLLQMPKREVNKVKDKFLKYLQLLQNNQEHKIMMMERRKTKLLSRARRNEI